MTVKDIVNKQIEYVRSQGGYSNIREADQTYNDMNRELIQAMAAENGTSFLGRFQFFGLRKFHVAEGTEPVFIKYTGQAVDNFDTDFVVPAEDTDLEDMIRSYNQPGKPMDMKLLDKIIARIFEIDGLPTIWY